MGKAPFHAPSQTIPSQLPLRPLPQLPAQDPVVADAARPGGHADGLVVLAVADAAARGGPEVVLGALVDGRAEHGHDPLLEPLHHRAAAHHARPAPAPVPLGLCDARVDRHRREERAALRQLARVQDVGQLALPVQQPRGGSAAGV